MDQIDAEAVKGVYSQAISEMSSASDEKAKAEAQVRAETAKAMGMAIGVTLG